MGVPKIPDGFFKKKKEPPTRPKIVCLCGSTRFVSAWRDAYRQESLAGRIVLSVGTLLHNGEGIIPQESEEKRKLDILHLRKIELADEILVLNENGYIGESTANEILHAVKCNKKIRWWVEDEEVVTKSMAKWCSHILCRQ